MAVFFKFLSLSPFEIALHSGTQIRLPANRNTPLDIYPTTKQRVKILTCQKMELEQEFCRLAIKLENAEKVKVVVTMRPILHFAFDNQLANSVELYGSDI